MWREWCLCWCEALLEYFCQWRFDDRSRAPDEEWVVCCRDYRTQLTGGHHLYMWDGKHNMAHVMFIENMLDVPICGTLILKMHSILDAEWKMIVFVFIPHINSGTSVAFITVCKSYTKIASSMTTHSGCRVVMSDWDRDVLWQSVPRTQLTL